MEKSEAINEIFANLSKAQGKIKPAKLDCFNPFHKSKYASLESVQNAYKDALSEHGLSVIQLVEGAENNRYVIKTVLGHTSGQWISNTFPLILSKEDMQGLGSAISYARRQAISAMLGIVDGEDDQGTGAARTEANKAYSKKVEETKAAIASAPPIKEDIYVKAQKSPNGGVNVTNYVKAQKEAEKEQRFAPPSDAVPTMDEAFPPLDDAKLFDVENYKLEFGKDGGKTLKELGPGYVKHKLEWVEKDCKPPLNPPMARFRDYAKLFLAAQPQA